MSALASIPLDRTELARLGILEGTEALLPSRSVLRLGWAELEQALPDRGLPRGVIEIAAMPKLSSSRGSASKGASHGEWIPSGTTTIAVAAIQSIHALDEHAWCAWISSTGSPGLYAPALAQANVDLDRLLIVRPSPQALARTAVKVATSGAFGLVVVDAPHRHDLSGGMHAKHVPKHFPAHKPEYGLSNAALKKDGGAVVVRKLALAAEEFGTTSVLLTNALTPRPVPWPVVLRLEVERRPDSLAVRVTKDRRGCGSSQHIVRLAS